MSLAPSGVHLWEEGDTQPQIKFNIMAVSHNLWVSGKVISRTTDAQPGSPAEGDAYIITGSATGAAWGGFTENYVAQFLDGAWLEYAPIGAVRVYVADEAVDVRWSGSAWTSPTASNEFADDVFRIQDNGDNTKQIAFQASGVSTGTTRTITMPDADVDLGNVTGEFSDATFRIKGSSDGTKKVAFEVDGLTSSTTRTVTMPDADMAPTPAGVAFEGTKYVGVNDQTGTTYELVLGDAGKLITMSNASPNTLTIPANASVAFGVGTRIDVLQKGAGQTTIAITSDTLNGADGLKINAQWEVASLLKISSTVWVMVGGVA